ncbi:hypothetical protein BS78_08G092700 [Paspalum vaginatum]|nr:hypothetical protein BS78_08G092700 [Paspalum vaginatum]
MAMPIFAMMANTSYLCVWAKEEIDAMCRRFLWAGRDQSIRGKWPVAWPVVAKPTAFGGLGIPDLKLLNYALQARWLWLQRVNDDRVWYGLPISVTSKVRDFCEASIFVTVGNGRKTLFWRHRWLDGHAIAIRDIAPALFAVIPRRVSKVLTVAEGLTNRAWIRGIVGALTMAVIEITLCCGFGWTPTLCKSVDDRVVLEMDAGQPVLSQIGVPDATPRIFPVPGP